MLQLIITVCRCHSKRAPVYYMSVSWTPQLWVSDERQTVFHGSCPYCARLCLQATASQSNQAPAGFTAQNQASQIVCVWRHCRSAIGVAHHNVKSERGESWWATFTVTKHWQYHTKPLMGKKQEIFDRYMFTMVFLNITDWKGKLFFLLGWVIKSHYPQFQWVT